jgi:hypothetical protein
MMMMSRNTTYLPPFLGSFALSNLSHIPFIVVSDVSHMRNQEIDRFEKMDRIVYLVSLLCPLSALSSANVISLG